ncbi:protein of unknown function (plasmid) [Rhodovastum atsumiense]|nr:protein of unknown function [Rhodovastum atsumiense]
MVGNKYTVGMPDDIGPDLAPRWGILPRASSPNGNLLLGHLPCGDHNRSAPNLEEVTLLRGQMLFEPGRVPPHVHFPHAGTLVSPILSLPEGRPGR